MSNDILDLLGMSDAEKAEQTKWFNELAISSRVELEKIENIFNTQAKDAIDNKLHESMDKDSFLKYLQSVTIGDVGHILPPPPGISIKPMPIGYYPQKMRKGAGGKQEATSDIICWSKLEAGGAELTKMTAYGPEAILKRNSILPFSVYDTKFAHDPKKKTPGIILGSVHPETSFDGNVINPDFVPPTIQERQNLIVSVLTRQVPIVPLYIANTYLSHLKQTDQGNNKKSNPFVDNTDIRCIQVTINDIQVGRQPSTNLEFCRLTVTDNTFVITGGHKGMNVWIDPQLPRKLNCGKGSFVKLLGTLAMDGRGQFPEMTACSLIPIVSKPYIEEASNLAGSNPGLISDNQSTEQRLMRMSL